MSLQVSQHALRRALVGALIAIAALGLGAELAFYLGGVDSSLVPMLSLSYEANLPTWYASLLLFACALALAANAAGAKRSGAALAGRWRLLSALFLYISLDEAVGIHEHLGVLELGGVLYFSWVVPAAAAVLLLALIYLPFLARLPPATRRGFVLAGALYVGGALGMELPLGWWTERAGNDNLTYALIDFVEEALELTGATLFLFANLRHFAAAHGALRLSPQTDPQTDPEAPE
ncbi:hypothetical protein [Haliangium ochraceum]|uniref:Uncharacterized protein n=1 Tax=Haliangium ochraceum (strain DSM 14365 / JCM 11303 / SMP-2) TaxID=502025 RepID=D0LR59_HALO1|nr:hypothetical protein [Haliangium ochraceum]ACY15567.1 conserved hypothetical protein [Haliangium ochraceum DSM 14365]